MKQETMIKPANFNWRQILAADPPTIEDAFLVRMPESYGLGIMDDRVMRAHWRRLRSIIEPQLPNDLPRELLWAVRYTPGLLTIPRHEPLRLAVREAHTRLRAECERTVLRPLPDEDERQLAYIARPWPRVRRSRFPAHEGFDPLGDEATNAATRCHQCWGRLVHPTSRAMRAYACFLLAIGEPVPTDMAHELIDGLIEEIACTIRGEEFSGYDSWTMRTGTLRAFAHYIDPYGRHPSAHEYGPPFILPAASPHEPVNIDTPYFWGEDNGRDLDGFLLTPCGVRRPDGTSLRLNVRQCSYWGPEAPDGPPPTLVVHHGTKWGDPYSLVSIEFPPAIVWGEPLAPDVAREIKGFIGRNATPLLEHWRGETDSVEMLEALDMSLRTELEGR